MKMTNSEYNEYVKNGMPKSHTLRDLARAFLIGGLICCVGEGLGQLYCGAGNLTKETAATWVAVTLVFLGALLTGLGVYDDIAKFGGAGTLVPITGFANAVVSPALEFKSEGFILGTAAKMFTIAGPVIVYGVGTSIIYGLVLCLFGVE